MQFVRPFSSFNSQIYTSRCAQIAGYLEDRSLHFVERFGLRLLKNYQWVRYGKDYQQRDFRQDLYFSSLNEGDTFPLPVDSEKRMIELLKENGKLKDSSTLLTLTEVGVTTLLLVLTIPISIPTSLVCLGLRCYVQNRMNDVICLTPAFKWMVFEQSLTLLTFNTGLSEFKIMNYVDGVTFSNNRASEIGQLLLRRRPTILALQEAFYINKVRKDIAESLCRAGYYVAFCSSRQKVFGMTSGLLLASLLPIVTVGFHQYTDSVGLDARTRKGVLAVVLQLSNRERILVATTHMQAGYPTGTHEEKIHWKKGQFQEAIKFIMLMAKESNVRDVFLMGDFNDGRFNLESISSVESNYMYPSIKEALLPATEISPGFKILTVPNRDNFFSTYLEKEKHFPVDPESQESGESKGTACNTAATSYKHFKEIVLLEVQKLIGVKENILKRWIYDRLACRPLHDSKISSLIDGVIEKVSKDVYLKGNCIDHVALINKSDNLYSEVGYENACFLPLGANGILSDHRIWEVTVYHKRGVSYLI